MPKTDGHAWTFKARFRRRSFGWRSSVAIARVREAVAEIKRVARLDRALAAEGAVLFLERVSPAVEQVDSSSGALGTAVNGAIETLGAIVASAPADATTRDAWLERLWTAFLADDMPYIELLGEQWGTLTASSDRASLWADRLIGELGATWRSRREMGQYFKGTDACLSSLLAARRFEEILELLASAPFVSWTTRRWGFEALAAQGRKAEALRYAEESRDKRSHDDAIDRACERLLLESGLHEEAYRRYGIAANRAGTYLATYRALAKKYPLLGARALLDDLVASTPGDEGKWFTAAKSAGLYDEAIGLANATPCDPRTLARAARDFADTNATFARDASLAALRWIAAGHGYELTQLDVSLAYRSGRRAAERLGCVREFEEHVAALKGPGVSLLRHRS